jgi:AAA domain, putative AbiEii toxin, Type IV TA system
VSQEFIWKNQSRTNCLPYPTQTVSGQVLGQLTALVGQNGAGKSNVADVVRFLAEALTIGLEAAIARRHGIDAVRRWSSGHPFNLGIRAHLSEESFSGTYAFTLAGDRAEDYRLKEEEALVIDKVTGANHKFRLREGKWAEGPPDLRPKVTGQSLAMTLVAGDERFAPLANALGNVCVYAVFPDTLGEPPLTLIGIEEPELTVHVGAIPLLYDYLKQASLRGVKEWLSKHMPPGRTYKPTLDQLALARMVDFGLLRASNPPLPCFGSLERAVAFLHKHFHMKS